MISRGFQAAALLPLAICLTLAPAQTAGDEGAAAVTGGRGSRPADLIFSGRLKPVRPRAGGIFTIEVLSEGGGNASAAAFHLVYDPALVEPVPSGFREGGWLRQGGASTTFLATPASTGERIVVGVARLGAARGARQGGAVCRLSFKALAPGSTAFAFDRAHVTSADGREIPSRFSAVRLTIAPKPSSGRP